MSDFHVAYGLSRGRFATEVEGLSKEQLNYRLYPGSLTIGEMAIHVAGVEVWFSAQLTGREMSAEEKLIASTATDGVVNDKPFPFSAEEITPQFVAKALALGRSLAEPLIESPSDAIREVQLVSALGPVIDGTGALARMTFHPGYHQGQAYQIKQAPGFPPA